MHLFCWRCGKVSFQVGIPCALALCFRHGRCLACKRRTLYVKPHEQLTTIKTMGKISYESQ